MEKRERIWERQGIKVGQRMEMMVRYISQQNSNDSV